MARRFMFVILVAVSVLHGVLAAGTDGDISLTLHKLTQRIELLEARDATKDARIAELESDMSALKSTMQDMDVMHRQKETSLQEQITILEKTIEHSHDAVDTELTKTVNGDRDENTSDRPTSTPNRNKRHTSNFLTNRAAPETEVAFYATHTDHDVHHLGHGQALLFQQEITNVGNAYNIHTGAFTAPVDGTYVFHATVMGVDVTGQNHVFAYFDVNGTLYSRFYVTAYDQSSQMLVINLKARQVVTVRNDYADTGFVGQHFSTFSGFLLYENDPSSVIVG